ncbi:MAG: GTPase [Planctomycetota bacterium]
MSGGTTTVCVLTPMGRSAVAVVRVAGPAAVMAVDANFAAANGKPLAKQPIDAVRFGRWRASSSGKGPGEELIVCRVEQSVVEVHCHGGYAAVRAVVAALVEAGCCEACWHGEALAGRHWIEIEARQALATCVTDRAAAVLLDQDNGALAAALEEIVERIDRGALADAATRCAALLRHSPTGLHLASPWRVVLAGPPNVGKSSLINALVGYERAIVFDQPGVTRDVVTAAGAVDGWPVEFADTAGLREPGDAIEAAGVSRTRDTARRADLLVLVEAFGGAGTPPPGFASTGVLLDSLGITQGPPPERVLRVANKSDLARDDGACAALRVSAATGTGVKELVAAIGRHLVPTPPAADEAVPFTPRHAEALAAAEAALRRGRADAARAAVVALLAAC